MNAKQAVSGGFDLDSFVGGAESPASIAPEPLKQPSKPVKAQKGGKPSVEAAKPAKSNFRAPKPKKENLSVRLQIRITEAEFEKLEKEAGMIPHSAFLRKFLQDNGLL